MKHLPWLVASLLVVLCVCSRDLGKTDSVIWDIDNLQSIGGNKPTVLGAPIAIDTPEGGAIQFDGEDDALILDTNPLAGFSGSDSAPQAASGGGHGAASSISQED